MLNGVARLAVAAPRRVIGAVILVLIGTGIFGVPVFHSLSSGGMRDPGSESSRTARILADTFGQGDMSMIATVTSPAGLRTPAARRVGTDIVTLLRDDPNVRQVTSAWTAKDAEPFISEDGTTGLIVAGISGNDNDAQKRARQLAEDIDDVSGAPDVTVRVGGAATVYWQINEQTQMDLLLMESLAMPLSFVALLWVFGGLFAAALPMVVGIVAVVGSMAALHGISLFTEVSVFAINLSIALGLALSIDYTLLILSRYRHELAAGRSRDQALATTMATAGRTVLFSAMTVALSMATMVIFPQYFLKSFAYAGVAVVAFAAAAAVIVTPAAIVLLGDRLDALDVRRPLRRLLRRDEPRATPVERQFWYRTAKFAMRHAVPVGLAVIGLLLFLGAPFLGVKWGFPDDRMLPVSASARQVGDELRGDFAADSSSDVSLVLSNIPQRQARDVGEYAAALSKVPAVLSVSSPLGQYVRGAVVGPPTGPTGFTDGRAFLTVSSSAALFSDESARQLDQLRAVPTPRGADVSLGGIAQTSRDSVNAITSRLPPVLGIIGVITIILLFLLTGSVILPVKALVMNVLSLTAAFGALVWVFQEGHLGALGSAVTGTLEVNIPVLLFCVAFGLSMDYEVFLISRIREYWLKSDRTSMGNEESVALGIAGTGRVITAAALLMSISFAALMASQVSFMRLFGLGLTVAVLVDATLVRMLLVPAFMKILGARNWWAPTPLVRLHERVGFIEEPGCAHSST